MRSEPVTTSPHEPSAIHLYSKWLRQLHALIAEGKGDDDEADKLRDEMDLPWRQLNKDELNFVQGLSADLYTLSLDSHIKHPLTGGINSNDFAAELRIMRRAGNFYGVLALLRDRPQCISADLAAFLRGWCYEQLGDFATAELFFEHAAKLDNKNDLYAMFALDPLNTSQPLNK